MIKCGYTLCVLVFFLAFGLYGQQDSLVIVQDSLVVVKDSVVIKQDSLSTIATDIENDSIPNLIESNGDIPSTKKNRKNRDGYFSMFEGKPGKAALMSTIVPGLGQIYNRQYWKAPIVWGAEGAAVYSIIWNHKFFKKFDAGYKAVLRGGAISYRGVTEPTTIRQYRERFRKYRDYSIAGFALAHVLNIADAFVGRHLKEFDMDDDISFHPTLAFPGIAMIISLN